ncbi:hypothetical protein BJ508DRAFT_151030 [Ascobolus immersus RN42]|uniref:RING-type E3 ubiquitin transferase n=1 Tax=Ascobolus immersus RN42 TaxID=1160509 RepID=A0A3N4I0F9_ASCIM|nr:hypothetical protein BJ508DRAFT_151030 [Ascobolus immersus RN42]
MSSSRVVYTIPDSPTAVPLSSPAIPDSPHLPPLSTVTGSSSNRSLPSLPTNVDHHTKPGHHRSQSSQTLPLTRPELGNSSHNPIDLTSSPPRPNLPLPPPPPPPRIDAKSGPVAAGTSSSTEQQSSRRRGSGYVTATGLPEWQPDHIVKKCPICEQHFSLFFRKHHCRICGRVVCANCSPHRITVPSSITVKPPNERPSESFPAQQALQGIANSANLSNRTSWIVSPAPLLSPALDGPEEVRMCNDCIRNPYTAGRTAMGNSHSSSSSSTASYGYPGGSSRGYVNGQTSSTATIPGGGGRSSKRRAAPVSCHPFHHHSTRLTPSKEQTGRSAPPNFHPNGASLHTQPPSITAAPYSDSPYGDPTAYYGFAAGTNGQISGAPATSQGNAFQLPLPPSMQTPGVSFPSMHLPQPTGIFHPFAQAHPSHQPRRSNSHRHSYHSHGGHLPYPAHNGPLPPIPVQNSSSGRITNPPHSRSFQAQPGPQLKETDFCPICTRALPPPDPVTGSEVERERHIEACINRSMNATSTSPPAVPAPTSSSVPNGGSARPRTMPRRSTVTKALGRMSTYSATAKDTHGVDGEPVECVICFEEFEEGDEMAMLDCLCRYHKACIRKWFDKKGNGNCPVHSSGEC